MKRVPILHTWSCVRFYYSKALEHHFTQMFQVDLTEPILSRFDILCVVRDTVDPIEVKTLLLSVSS